MNIIDLARLKLDPLLRYAIPTEDKSGINCFTVDPALIYPAAIADMEKTTKEDKGWTEVIFLNDGVRNSLSHLDLALIPKSETFKHPEEIQILRGVMLELARKWFTEKLHAFIGHKKMKVIIRKNVEWRL